MGEVEEVAPGLRRVVAPNPSPMTFRGTNTYLIGTREVAVVDPGPDDPAHLAAIRAALGDARVSHVLVTHPHRDHSGLARRLAGAVGAPVLGFGPPGKGRSPLMQALAAAGAAGGGEGVDAGFHPDRELGPGEAVEGDGWRLDALWTPGHFSGHLCFALGDVVLTGDHVMGWASSLISPPDGDVGAFVASCERLLGRRDRLFLPGHGDPVADPRGRLEWLIAHRRARERELIEALGQGPARIATLARRIYRDTPLALLPAAERNVFAHLVELVARGTVRADPALSSEARFALV